MPRKHNSIMLNKYTYIYEICNNAQKKRRNANQMPNNAKQNA
jgi:hypothetical protein